MAKFIINIRFWILVAMSLTLFLLVSKLQVSFWYVLAAGALLGVVFGKVFCRWMCPIGLIMEIVISSGGYYKKRLLYNHNKIGCPIAWISGFLNRFSLLKIQNNFSRCKKCGLCDKNCYIVAMEPGKYSLYKDGMLRPGSAYVCSRCLECVAACPAGSLKFGIKKEGNTCGRPR